MSWLHLHLAINHLPIMGFFLATLVMVAALIFSLRETFLVSCWLCVIASLGGIFTYISGEETKELLEGFGIPELAKVAINAHEQAAAMTLLMSLAAISAGLGALLVFQKQPLRPIHKIGWIVAIVNVLSCGTAGYTGYLGAQISHQELRGEGLIEPAKPEAPLGEDALEEDDVDTEEGEEEK